MKDWSVENLRYKRFHIWRRFDSCLLKEKNHGSVSLTAHLVNSNCFTWDTLKAASSAKKENQEAGGGGAVYEVSTVHFICSAVRYSVVWWFYWNVVQWFLVSSLNIIPFSFRACSSPFPKFPQACFQSDPDAYSPRKPQICFLTINSPFPDISCIGIIQYVIFCLRIL